MSLVKFNAALELEDCKNIKVGGAIKVYGLTKKIVSIDSFQVVGKLVKVNGSCEDFRQEPVNQLSMFGVDGL